MVVWHAFLAFSVTDAEGAEILARVKRSQQSEVARRLTELHCPSDHDATARRLIALADGLAARVLIGDLDPSATQALIREEINTALHG